ncbi:MAG TPA: PhzF family phenazine biosynthesis protein [Bacteroidia bacterium]|nr:PhzF family phenazine biosynthesis protein [Bacteroidia bacterium]
MQIKIYQVDAFTDKVFGGNPAAICPLDEWLPDELLQGIASENNLAETAFYVKSGQRYEIRWFTPAVEVDLCGHATLAAAYVLFHFEGHAGSEINFYSRRSGNLPVTRNGELLTLNFPADEFVKIPTPDNAVRYFGKFPLEVLKGKTDYMFVFESENDILALQPDISEIKRLEARGVIVTAKGDRADFVSRFFAPQSGISEDPVTGSAHTTLAPYWAEKLGRNELDAIQLSARRGFLHCANLGRRVEISGMCCAYMTGQIII